MSQNYFDVSEAIISLLTVEVKQRVKLFLRLFNLKKSQFSHFLSTAKSACTTLTCPIVELWSPTMDKVGGAWPFYVAREQKVQCFCLFFVRHAFGKIEFVNTISP